MLSRVCEQEEGTRLLQRVVNGTSKFPLLLVGPSGTGRRFSVLQAAKQSFGSSSIMVDAGTHPDLWQVEPEPDKEIKVDVIRDLLSRAQTCPTLVRDRYIIVDGADRLNVSAANALLKTLEEPPATTRFFLLAERRQDVLPTIRSRCGLVRYNRLSESFIVSELVRLGSDPTVALMCARLTDGSLGRATKLYFSARLALRDGVLAIFKAAVHKDFVTVFCGIDALDKDLKEGLDFLDHLLRDAFLVEYDPTAVANLDRVSDLREIRQKFGLQRLSRLRFQLRELSLLPSTAVLSFHVKSAFVNAIQG